MWKLTENLYLAQQYTIVGPCNEQQLRNNNIKRVLTVTTEPIPEKNKLENIDYKFIRLLDMPNEPILSNGLLEEAIKCIDEGIEKKENVVVHCLAAISRSVTICAAFLMFKNQWKIEKALKMIESVRKSIGPNPGFLSQLKIWERCGMRFEADLYKNSKLEIPGVPNVDSATIWRLPVLDDPAKIRFKCRQCRKTIFDSENMAHPEITSSCQKYLIEPMAWLDITGVTCSINHSCGAKLGNFIAAGSKCNGCNKFVNRWIFIDKSKVDEVKVAL